MRVLLLSPVSGRDIAGGDVAYTEALMARSPAGVEYTSYDVALENGSLVERGRRPGHGKMRAVDALIFGARAIEIALRRSGRVFREPFRYLTADPDAFDLVHSHIFATRLVDTDLPLVTSSGFPLPVLYEDRFHWSHRRVVAAAGIERAMARAVGAEVSWIPPRRAAVAMVQSDHYRQHLVSEGADPDRVVVRTLGIEGRPGAPRTGIPQTIGYVSGNFDGKGGREVLAAFARLLVERPEAHLVIVGSAPRELDPALFPPGSVEWHGVVPRARVLGELLPRIDVLVLPSRCDSGPPYVILEALQQGIPVVTSDLPWIDEGLAGPGVRRVPVDPDEVSRALADLFCPDTYRDASQAAIDLWKARYSMEILAEQVGETYRAALRRNRR